MLNIGIISFDYELFLGEKSGTLLKSLIEPTEIILKILHNKANSIFFIDSLYILKLEEQVRNEFLIVKEQIQKIIKEGHDIGFHFHPQWIDAYRIGEEWTFNSFNNYSFRNLSNEKLSYYFNTSFNLLCDIAKEIKKDYKILAFRAGGWCIQPFIRIKELFIKNELEIDMSVLPGMKNENLIGGFDFSFINKMNYFWSFENDPLIEEKGRFYEVPVTTFRLRKILKSLDYHFHKRNEKEYGDGKAISVNRHKTVHEKIKSQFKKECYSLSLDGLSFDLFKKILGKLRKDNIFFVHTVGHPKKLSKSFLLNIEYFIKNYNTINIFHLKKILDKGEL